MTFLLQKLLMRNTWILLSKALHCLENHGLELNNNKSTFLSPSVVYLGHRIDQNGLHPSDDKVHTVKDAPCPTNITQLKVYLGLLTYYSKFLPNLASTLAPLYSILRSSTRWQWTEEHEATFRLSKSLLLSSKVLAHYDHKQQLILACDESTVRIGAVLSHRYPGGSKCPVSYVSHSLFPTERSYSQIEREGLVCVFGTK